MLLEHFVKRRLRVEARVKGDVEDGTIRLVQQTLLRFLHPIRVDEIVEVARHLLVDYLREMIGRNIEKRGKLRQR